VSSEVTVDELWAVTSYFNPLGWRSRLENYRSFRRHLAVPLVTVEWHPLGEFQLGPADAEVLVQVRGGDLMWQKERLLNIGVASVPAEVEFVAWLDCDIVFCRTGWPEAAVRALKEHRAVQLFSDVRFLTQGQSRELVGSADAPSRLARSHARGSAVKPSSASLIARAGAGAFAGPHDGSPGMAWAARRSTIVRSGLFDRAIVGSGDFFWLLGALGIAAGWLAAREELGTYGYLAGSSYLDWSAEAHALIEAQVGFLRAPLLHLHHGSVSNRRYFDRHVPINRLGMDIDRDIALSADGVWKFVNPKPEWTSVMRSYFLERREDDA